METMELANRALTASILAEAKGKLDLSEAFLDIAMDLMRTGSKEPKGNLLDYSINHLLNRYARN
ncbi:hypothetical protein LHP98_19255 [Rhodobacter sp. Har01]|uniref:hypothetical protein n=1 Tax=Rhodobacter sp. Har01 TaxID=2883999 RepID=UPI001D05E619|nr:hypothetical protein [Rhodobacter sp. Har01]MCB6180242.1 hypothetical protein [Rhodobacter sp. Har01]